MSRSLVCPAKESAGSRRSKLSIVFNSGPLHSPAACGFRRRRESRRPRRRLPGTDLGSTAEMLGCPRPRLSSHRPLWREQRGIAALGGSAGRGPRSGRIASGMSGADLAMGTGDGAKLRSAVALTGAGSDTAAAGATARPRLRPARWWATRETDLQTPGHRWTFSRLDRLPFDDGDVLQLSELARAPGLNQLRDLRNGERRLDGGRATL